MIRASCLALTLCLWFLLDCKLSQEWSAWQDAHVQRYLEKSKNNPSRGSHDVTGWETGIAEVDDGFRPIQRFIMVHGIVIPHHEPSIELWPMAGDTDRLPAEMYLLYWLLGDMVAIHPDPGQGQWRMKWILPERWACCRRLKRYRQQKNVLMDPGQNEQLEGDCTYACLAFTVWGDFSKGGADAMRRLLARQWKHPQNSGFLKKVSDWEACTPEQYVEQYVMMGWGGLPEIYLCAISKMIRITVVAADGTAIAEFGGTSQKTNYMLFDRKHYSVVRVPPEGNGHGQMASQNLREGGKHDRPKSPPKQGYSPGLQLVSRDGTLRVEQPEEDTRLPLERRKRAAPKVEEDPDLRHLQTHLLLQRLCLHRVSHGRRRKRRIEGRQAKRRRRSSSRVPLPKGRLSIRQLIDSRMFMVLPKRRPLGNPKLPRRRQVMQVPAPLVSRLPQHRSHWWMMKTRSRGVSSK